MKELNLYRIWQIINKLYEKQYDLDEEGIYIYLLGNNSNYVEMKFETFLENYSFKVEDTYISVFNDDAIPWEEYRNNDFIIVPKETLSLTDNELIIWIENKVQELTKIYEESKIAEKERIKADINILNKQLENL